MLWEPHIEGRNAHATVYEIYFKDPFLAYAYISSIALFIALYQAFMFLGYIGRNQTFSPDAVRSIRIIKNCATILIALIGGALGYIVIFVRGKDDIAGGVAVGVGMIFIFAVVAATAAVFEKILRDGEGSRST